MATEMMNDSPALTPEERDFWWNLWDISEGFPPRSMPTQESSQEAMTKPKKALNSCMSVLDEIKELIPDGKYKEMADSLKVVWDDYNK